MRYPVTAIIVAGILTYLSATWLARKIAARGFSLPEEGRRIGCIDGLRGYLALSVLVGHGVIWTQVTRLGGSWTPPTINLFNELGAGSVALFFMVTGLVFYPRIRCGFQATSWPVIGITRFFRIIPLQLASVLIVTAIIAAETASLPGADYPSALIDWMSGRSEPPLLGYPESGRLNAFVLWSLWYEWLFYLLVMPACAVGVDLLRGRLPTVVVPIALLLAGLSAWAFGWDKPKLLGFLPFFAVGMIAYECQLSDRVRGALSSGKAAVIAAAALAVGINASAFPYSFVVMPLLGFLFICVACGNPMFGVLRSEGALVLGEISFGIYLLHGLVLYCLFTGLGGALGRLPAGMALIFVLPAAALLVVLFGSVAHLFIERPGIRAGALLAKTWTSRRLSLQAQLQGAP